MDFLSMFRPLGGQQGQQPGQQAANPLIPGDTSTQLQQRGGGQQQSPENNTQNSNLAPGSQGPANNQQQSSATDDPLASFKDLWNNVPNKEGSANDFQLINANPDKIKEISDKIDFSKSIDPALAQKALAGDVGSLSQLMNGMARQVFQTAIQASSHLVDRQSSQAVDHIKKTLPNQFKEFSAKNSLRAENPHFSNPAVQPLLDVIQQQIAARNPDASPEELKAYAKQYLSGVAGLIAPPGKADASQDDSGDENKAFTNILKEKNKQVNDFDWDFWSQAQMQKQPGT